MPRQGEGSVLIPVERYYLIQELQATLEIYSSTLHDVEGKGTD
jgi:hypothetical protein